MVKPLLYTTRKVQAVVQMTLGYLVRIGIFSFGEWNRSYFKRKIIELYKGGCYDTHNRVRFDPFRLKQAFGILEGVGGIRFDTHSKDGTKLDAMMIRYRDVKAKIKENGGKIVDCLPIEVEDMDENLLLCKENHKSIDEYIDVILPDGDSEKWGEFSKKYLDNLGLEQTKITLRNGKTVDGYILKYWKSQNPTRPKPNQCFVRCNAPTESFPMGKRDIMRRVLGARSDVLAFDYRGTWKSEGVPTEGGYYLDAETMVEKAVNEFGYKWTDIWADGFCLGGAIAMHLKKKYHQRGINIFVQNTFDSMLNTLKKQVFPANHLSPIGLDEIRSRDPFINAKTDQDSLDSAAKLQEIRGAGKHGVSIVYNTDTDTTIDPRSHTRLSSELDQVSDQTFSVLFKHPDKSRNGHSYDVLSERRMWDKEAVTYITAKDYPEILDPSPSFFNLFR